MQQVEPAVGLDVEDKIEFPRVFVAQKMASFQTGSVQQNIDTSAEFADFCDNSSHSCGVGQVDAEVVRLTSRSLHRANRSQRRVRALQRSQLTFDECRSGAFAARLDAGKEVTLQRLFVGGKLCQVGVLGIRLGNEIEQVERAACGRSQ